MATNDFRKIKTFKQLQEARSSLEYQIDSKRGKLWVPFALTVIRAIKSRLTDE
ncbi:MAG: hypothetical protein K2O58_10330 [Bacteroidales bacterium]|nr:hypothetical protein [Bacteroidales bacterium]MDE7128265.1 hypothetical protein [Bacteroidales bacterium]